MKSVRSRSIETGDRFRRVSSAWIRAFAAGRNLRLPSPLSPLQSGTVTRGGFDVDAAWNRWHEPALEAGFAAKERPFFALLDRARIERLASRGWPGMASNLGEPLRLAPSGAPWQPLYLCARLLADGQRGRARSFVEEWHKQHESSTWRAGLGRWRRALGMTAGQSGFDPDRFRALANVMHGLLLLDAWNDDVLADARTFAERVGPLVRQCGQTLAATPDGPAPGDDSPAEFEGLELVPDASEEDAESEFECAGEAEPEPPVARAYPGYSVFTQALDETASASRWFLPEDLALLQRLKALDRRRSRQLAHRLQRRLQVARQRHWEFDQEDGLVDSRRLCRLVQADSELRIFRRETDAPVPEAAVSLLVDLSGSMRGERLLSAAVAIDLAVHVLETSGIQCEVLGYTTRFAGENPIHAGWLKAGKPQPAGRLNAIRHVVFKPALRPWRRTRQYLGLLMRDGFGCENIDGEALHWAAGRLMRIEVPRRILIVLSDGAPFDQSTAAVNGREYLCDHLRKVIKQLELSPIDLVAMGTGTDVSRYYRRSVMLSGPEAVSEALFERLGDLLTHPNPGCDNQ